MKTYIKMWNEHHGFSPEDSEYWNPEDDPRETPENYVWWHDPRDPQGSLHSTPKPASWDDLESDYDEVEHRAQLLKHATEPCTGPSPFPKREAAA
jgi:hypothetical protein